MPGKQRMQGLQDDLLRTATDLDSLCQALEGHARYLRHSIHQADAEAMSEQAEGLHDSACTLRDIARNITT